MTYLEGKQLENGCFCWWNMKAFYLEHIWRHMSWYMSYTIQAHTYQAIVHGSQLPWLEPMSCMSCQATEKKLTQTQSSTIATRLKEKQVGFRGGSFNKMNTIELVPPQKKGKTWQRKQETRAGIFLPTFEVWNLSKWRQCQREHCRLCSPVSFFFLCPFSTGPMLGTILQCEGPKRDVNVG